MKIVTAGHSSRLALAGLMTVIGLTLAQAQFDAQRQQCLRMMDQRQQAACLQNLQQQEQRAAAQKRQQDEAIARQRQLQLQQQQADQRQRETESARLRQQQVEKERKVREDLQKKALIPSPPSAATITNTPPPPTPALPPRPAPPAAKPPPTAEQQRAMQADMEKARLKNQQVAAEQKRKQEEKAEAARIREGLPKQAAQDPWAPVTAATPAAVLTPSQMEACTREATAMQLASQKWQGTVQEISTRLGKTQKELFLGRCRAHPQAAAYVAGTDKMLREAQARTPPKQEIRADVAAQNKSLSAQDQGSVKNFPYPDSDSCMVPIYHTRGTLCNKPNSVEVVIENRCPHAVSLHFCLWRTDRNRWDCGSEPSLGTGQVMGRTACESDGRYAFASCTEKARIGRFRDNNCGGNPNNAESVHSYPKTRPPACPGYRESGKRCLEAPPK